MAASLLRQNKVLYFFGFGRKAHDLIVTSNRTIMTSRARMERVVEDLQKNPYFEKYAQKIAKLQETSPEEFLSRCEEKERKIREEKVFFTHPKKTSKSQSLWKTMSHVWRSSRLRNQSFIRSYSQMASKTKYITTPIFYVNAAPHIGHLYTAVVADCIAKFNQMQGHQTVLNTGTDEHGNKVQRAAKQLSLPVDLYCELTSKKFREMCEHFQVDYTNFIRTTEPHHQKTVQYFWKLLEEKNHIYKGKYTGWYCVPDEAFLFDQDLVDKKTPSGDTIKVSAESGHPVEWTEEDNYKFRLSSFQDDLRHWLKDEKVVQPSVYHKILSQWVEDERCLADLSISRPRSRAPWGIRTPSDPDQTIYVWLDALVNYLTVLGYPHREFKQFWPPTVQVIGKDILKFHGIYWPAFLMAVGLEPPKTLLCHSHWTVDNEKMSKSKGNVVSPFDAAKQFSADGLRYFLLRDSVPHNDANYSTERVLNVLNSELADTLGNLINRCTGKLVNPKQEIPSAAGHGRFLKSEVAQSLRASMEALGDTAKQHYESFYVHHVVDAAMSTVRCANAVVEYHKPWSLRKEPDNEAAVAELKAVIALALEATRISALVLYPVMPALSTVVLDFLNVPMNERSWKHTKPVYLNSTASTESEPFGHSNTIIFPKIKLAA
ncbi:methionine--tRNA ligase, mitochondrial isoform X1 [Copidosoma floridanum]|uniref:methionine--tRNA ligase, mitochondrial isoform X1 n=1 Tax=Copidosoma floridanum TaxID=29053 RepID=UPI0006C9929A|nr:methionine--tRNA ligase, mitochondrial isoform X1 [Copidosoma floridanum]